MLFTSRNYPRCPRCKSDRVYFSSPKPGDFFFKLILQAPVRCQACYTRFGTWFKAKKTRRVDQGQIGFDENLGYPVGIAPGWE